MTEIEIKNPKFKEIDKERDLFPYCLVWTTIPVLSYIIPFIGHTGICTSNGAVHDFAGSNRVTINQFFFGRPLKYVKLSHSDYSENEWDDAIKAIDYEYSGKTHQLCFSNCHDHCADVLNHLEYETKRNYSSISIVCMLILKGKYVSYSAVFKTYFPFCLIVLIFVGIFLLIKFTA